MWQCQPNTLFFSASPISTTSIHNHVFVAVHTLQRAATLITARQTHCWMEVKHQLKASMLALLLSVFTLSLSPSIPLSQFGLLLFSPSFRVCFFLIVCPFDSTHPSFFHFLHPSILSFHLTLLPFLFFSLIHLIPSNPCLSLLPWWRGDLAD